MNAAEMIDRVHQALEEGWGYIWGTSGQTWTVEKQAAATREMTVKYGARWIGRRVTDCSGLLVWAAKQGGERLPHGSNSIWRNSLSARAELEEGAAPPRGAAVFKRSAAGGYDHVGLWDGERVIEAKGTRYGVVASSLKGWTHWGWLAILTEEEGEAPDLPREVSVRVKNVNLRRAPDQGADLVARLPEATRLAVVRQSAPGWREVQVCLRGHVMAKFLKEEDP